MLVAILFKKFREFLTENRRSVFISGHSLRGAFPTVCSIDILLGDLPLSADQITVATFGSPKCGNKSWNKVYNSMVPSHWGVYLGPDAVSMMPLSIGYTHDSKTALLNSGGYLIPDLSALDSSYSQEVPSISFHKKPEYKLAFSVVCEIHLDGLDSGICSFPVSESALRQWKKQCMMSFSESHVLKLLTIKFDKKENRTIAHNED